MVKCGNEELSNVLKNVSAGSFTLHPTPGRTLYAAGDYFFLNASIAFK